VGLAGQALDELAVRLAPYLEPGPYRMQLSDATGVVLTGGPERDVRAAASRALGSIWPGSLLDATETVLSRLVEEAEGMLAGVAAARAEIEGADCGRRLGGAIAVAVAEGMAGEAALVSLRLSEAESELTRTPPDERCDVGARAVASVLALHGIVPPLELASTRGLDASARARRVATAARRARVRRTLGDLAGPASAFPLLAREVERLRRLPHVDAGRDPLWLALVDASEI
jgi:hypothetical protein